MNEFEKELLNLIIKYGENERTKSPKFMIVNIGFPNHHLAYAILCSILMSY